MAGRHKKKIPEDTFYRDLGSSIRLARVAAGKTQAAVAAHLDVSSQQVQKHEKGTNRIPVRELVSLAEYLDVSISYLVGADSADEELRSLAGDFRADGFYTLLESWAEIKDQQMRTTLLNLVKGMAALSR